MYHYIAHSKNPAFKKKTALRISPTSPHSKIGIAFSYKPSGILLSKKLPSSIRK